MDKKEQLLMFCAVTLSYCDAGKRITEEARVKNWSQGKYQLCLEVFGMEGQTILRAGLAENGLFFGAVFSEIVPQKGQHWILVADDLVCRFADFQSLYNAVKKLYSCTWAPADCYVTKKLRGLASEGRDFNGKM